ncbi:MAG: HD domain-containing protein [Treponemataceae bacterium]
MIEAVIEIGSTGIRLVIAQSKAKDEWEIIDQSELPVSLGWDVFTESVVLRETLLQCLNILNRFKEQLQSWEISNNQITVIATSALREAQNRDSIIDRIMIKTGFIVRVIDGIEENQLMYTAVLNTLSKSHYKLDNINSIIIEVGGCSTELMLLDQGKMAAVHSFRFGTVLIEQQLKNMMGSQKELRMFLEDFIKNTSGNLNNELNLSHVYQFITIAPDVLLAAQQMGEQVAKDCWVISRMNFDTFIKKVEDLSIDECIAHFKISYNEARSLKINLLIYKLFLHLTQAEEIIIPETNIREGVFFGKNTQVNNFFQDDFFSQIIASAINFGRKFRFDEKHALCVCKVALKLFDALKHELGFEKKERLLLEVASLLHDIGMYIRSTDHHLHSKYIIEHSEIFGLTKDNMTIISSVAKLHRGKVNITNDINFSALQRQDRIMVLKLASILRLADSLDSSHSQRIKDFSITLGHDSLILKVKGTHNISHEKIMLKEKSDLFQEIFGYTVSLV